MTTYNLRIALIDKNEELLDNPEFLQKIYDEIANKKINRTVCWRTLGNNINVSVLWKKQTLTHTEKLFMGDLFMKDKYELFDGYFTDSNYLLRKFMKTILLEIEEKYFNNTCKIIFHISKLLNINGNRPLCTLLNDSYDIKIRSSISTVHNNNSGMESSVI